MKPLLVIALAFGKLALADETADRAAIDKLIVELRDRGAPHDQLYTSDSGDSRTQLERIVYPGRDTRQEPTPDLPPMSEMSQPLFVVNAVRFITPDVALVDAVSSQYGSMYNRRMPVLLILRKTKEWQIAVVRVQPNQFPGLVNFPGAPIQFVERSPI